MCGRQDVLGVDQGAAAVELLDLAELEEDSGHPKEETLSDKLDLLTKVLTRAMIEVKLLIMKKYS